MELEVCVIKAKGDDAAALVAAMNDGGAAALQSCAGCHKVAAMQGIEKPGTMLLLVEWDSVAAHEAAKGSDPFNAFVATIGPHIAGGADVLHYR
jgi:quinol monooxygenase YgiN